MINFRVDWQSCTRCGLCVADCPARIISMSDDGCPRVAPGREASCYRCQHCLAVCPPGAISILGLTPKECRPLDGNLPVPEQMETLVRGRRSVRRYREENLPAELIQRLLEVAWQAPTGVNSRQVLFTVVDDRRVMAELRKEVMGGLAGLVRNKALSGEMGMFAEFVRVWEEKGRDIIFRDAPHLLVVSAPRQVVTPQEDCLIALTYFELYAQASGVGTLWNGMAKWALNDLLPEFRIRLGIPDDHLFGYAMVFGWPAYRYVRTIRHTPALVNRVTG